LEDRIGPAEQAAQEQHVTAEHEHSNITSLSGMHTNKVGIQHSVNVSDFCSGK
jgi:hypothetical protein